MNPLLTIVLASWLAGAAAFLGGSLARFEGTAESETKRELIHGIVGFGGGILVAAVAFALVPQGMNVLSPGMLASIFCLGGLAFCALDAAISRHGGPRAQFMAMLMDFVPEALSLGAVFVHDQRLGILLALFIGAQNLPEGFNAYREMRTLRVRPRRALTALCAISLLGPLAALTGYLLLQNRVTLTAGIMVFAAGGILYLIFQDIAPQTKLRRHWTPALGAVVGFVVGMIGKQVLG